MRKNFSYLLICFLFISCIGAIADSMDDFTDVNRMWDGQKTITEKDFENVMDALQQKQKQKEEKVNKKKLKKISGGGTSLHRDLDPSKDIKENEILQINKDGVLVNVPVRLFIDNATIETGYYKVIAKKEEDKQLYINFYQSHFFKGKIKAIETENDYGEENIDFAKIIPCGENFVKLIYGSAEYNAYVYIPYEM